MTRSTRYGRIMADASAYLGFAVRAGKTVYGIDNIERCKKRIYALVLCPTASENLADKTKRFAERRHLPVVVTKAPLEAMIFKRNCKALALLDEHLAKAVTEAIGR